MAFSWVPVRPGLVTLALLMTAAVAWAANRPPRREYAVAHPQAPIAAEVAPTAVADSALPLASARPEPQESPRNIGLASYYGPALDGRPTANGERFDMQALTAAHRTLPFGTRVRVTNLRNGNVVIVRINDRGPYVRGRMVDLSYGAADRLGLVSEGTARVSLEVL